MKEYDLKGVSIVTGHYRRPLISRKISFCLPAFRHSWNAPWEARAGESQDFHRTVHSGIAFRSGNWPEKEVLLARKRDEYLFMSKEVSGLQKQIQRLKKPTNLIKQP